MTQNIFTIWVATSPILEHCRFLRTGDVSVLLQHPAYGLVNTFRFQLWISDCEQSGIAPTGKLPEIYNDLRLYHVRRKRLLDESIPLGDQDISTGDVFVLLRGDDDEISLFIAMMQQTQPFPESISDEIPVSVSSLSMAELERIRINRSNEQARQEEQKQAKTSQDSPSTQANIERNRVFISYSHKDTRWLERLQVHLRPLEQVGTITRWDDTMIKPGERWREEIKKGLETAKVAILLITADFLASDFITSNELPPLLVAAEKLGAVILPVIVGPCRFEETKSLSQFQAVNPPSQPLSKMAKARREEYLVKVTRAVEAALKS